MSARPPPPPLRCPIAGCARILRSHPTDDASMMLLPCSHLVCISHKPLFAEANACCPVCRGNVTELVTEYAIGALGEAAVLRETAAAATTQVATAPPPNCPFCELEDSEVPSTHGCEECAGGKTFCGPHADAHVRTKKHTLRLLDGAPVASAVGPKMCVTHPGQELAHICLDHDKALCLQCVAYDHPLGSHRVKPIVDVASELLARTAVLGERLAAGSMQASSFSSLVNDALNGLVESTSEVVARVNQVRAAMINAVNAAADSAITEANSLSAKRVKVLDSQQHEHEATAALLAASGSACELAVASGDVVNMATAVETGTRVVELVKPFPGLATPTTIDVIADVAAMVSAVSSTYKLVELPVDADTSDVWGPGLGVVAAADGGPLRGVELTNEDWVVTLLPRGTAGNIVHLSPGDVSFVMTDSTCTPVGSHTVTVGEDGLVSIPFDIDDATITSVNCALTVRSRVIKRWMIEPLISPIDAARSSVAGPGITAFAVGDAAGTQNIITVKAFNRHGRPVVLAPAHVKAMTQTGAGGEAVGAFTITCSADGTATLGYLVHNSELASVYIEVFVCDVKVWCGVVPKRATAFAGVHRQTYTIQDTDIRRGLAVSHDGHLIAISSYGSERVDLYSLEPAFLHLRKLGSKGAAPAQFNSPRFMCFTPAGTLLVCDHGNNRVQELNFDGSHIRSISNTKVWSVALHGDLLVIGSYIDTVSLFTYSTGALLRTFGSGGDGPGQLNGVEGLAITRDGRHILVAERDSARVSVFTTAGVFVKHIGIGTLAAGNSKYRDIAVLPNSTILVSDPMHRLFVFSPDGDTLVNTIGSQGTADGQFKYPTALAVHGSRVFVLDNDSPRVQVFE